MRDQNISWQQLTREESKVKTANAVYDRLIHKLCLTATKEELDNST